MIKIAELLDEPNFGDFEEATAFMATEHLIYERSI
jgi:hypothetical protein